MTFQKFDVFSSTKKCKLFFKKFIVILQYFTLFSICISDALATLNDDSSIQIIRGPLVAVNTLVPVAEAPVSEPSPLMITKGSAGVLTSVQPHTPLVIITNPKRARQPLPASDGSDYLKTIPGFSAIRSGGTNGDPVLRGMFGSRLNIRTNGDLMLGACPMRMDNPASYIAPKTYDKLTVVKGPESVIWGPGASAGTVLFEREPEHFKKPDSRIDASALVGSNGRIDKVLDGAVGDEKGYLRVVGNTSKADNYEDGDGDTIPSSWDKWNADVALGWTPNKDTLLELTAGRGDGESRYAGRGKDSTQLLRNSLGLRFKQTNIGPILDKIEAQIYYSYANHIMDNFHLRTSDSTPSSKNMDRRTVGGRWAATFKWKEIELVTGLDLLRSEHRFRNSEYDSATGDYDSPSQFPFDKDAVSHNYGLFSELTWHLNEYKRIVTGGRLDRSTSKDYRDEFNGLANPTQNKQRGDTLPSGFLRYEEDLKNLPVSWYIGLGHVERFPDYWELFSPDNSAFDSLDPEKTTQIDIGIQYKTAVLNAWASAYVGKVNDFILFNYDEDGDSSAENVDARILGGELGASYRIDSNWTTEASLAYAWGKNSSSGDPLPQIPPLETKFSLTYAKNQWTAGALWRLVAAQNRVALGQGNVVGRDFQDSSGFGVFSLNGSYKYNKHLEFSSGIDNLFDNTYSEHLNLAGNAGFGVPAESVAINEPGRTLWVKVDLSF